MIDNRVALIKFVFTDLKKNAKGVEKEAIKGKRNGTGRKTAIGEKEGRGIPANGVTGNAGIEWRGILVSLIIVNPGLNSINVVIPRLTPNFM